MNAACRIVAFGKLVVEKDVRLLHPSQAFPALVTSGMLKFGKLERLLQLNHALLKDVTFGKLVGSNVVRLLHPYQALPRFVACDRSRFGNSSRLEQPDHVDPNVVTELVSSVGNLPASDEQFCHAPVIFVTALVSMSLGKVVRLVQSRQA